MGSTADPPKREVRLVLIRHGESANRGRGGRPADEDPALSDRGAAQAAALADSPLVASLAGATVVSSPMRRALLTAEPCLPVLGRGARPDVLVHGELHEYRCGKKHAGGAELARAGYTCVGAWATTDADETEAACRARLARVAAWLTELARGDATPSALVAFGHQTVFDLLVQLLETGSGDRWGYGAIQHRLGNTGSVDLRFDGARWRRADR